MTTQNYLGISPSTGIAKQFEKIDYNDPAMIRKLIADIDEFVKTVEAENVRFLQARQQNAISSAETFKFFRSQERTRNSRLILQYLVTFLTKLPMRCDLEETVVNPFEQLKTFARNNVNLLKENDVSAAILKEHEKLGLLNDTNEWYYKGQISKNHKELLQVLETARNISIMGYCKLFETLQRLCLFWFSVRNEDVKRVRRSDLFLYQLTLILLERHLPKDT